MNKFEIHQLRDLPIESVAERLGLKVTRHKALCPFHDDKHPSLSFSVSRNTYKCFVCGAHGGTIDLAMQVLRKGFVDACDWLANEHNVRLSEFQPSTEVKKYDFDARKYLRFFEHPFINNLASEFLFNKRHLDPRVIRWCRLNSYKEWLQIPYFDMEGKLIGIQSRYLGADKSQPRFRFPSGNQCHIYNQQIIPMLREGEPLYIAEGCSDCWSLLSAGHKAIAIPSATLLKKEDVTTFIQHLPPNTRLYMYPDNDEPGQRLFQQLESMLKGSLCASGSLSTGEGGGKSDVDNIGVCVRGHLSALTLPSGCKDFSDYYLQCHTSLN